MTMIPCPLRKASRERPSEAALVRKRGTITWAELDQLVSAAADRLRQRGLDAGEKVALFVEDRVANVILLMAVIRAEGTAGMISTRIPPVAVQSRLDSIGSRVIVTDRPTDLQAQVSGVDIVPADRILGEPSEQRRADTSSVVCTTRQPVTVVFTSGSTGEPKAALHSFGNHYYNALGSNRNIELLPGDRWLLSLPLYHVGGIAIVFRCLLAQAAMVIPEVGMKVDEAIEAFSVTHVSLVSTQLYRLLNSENVHIGRHLRAILLGGSAFEPGLLDEAYERGLPVHVSYGLTEMASQVTATQAGARREELNTAGRVLPYREVAIGIDNEILVRGDTLFMGYVEGNECYLPQDRSGWFHTGDLGEIDASGFLHVHGRKDNLFISGGENIQPEEIERALGRIEGVGRAVVVPVPDEEFGFRPVAFVQLKSRAKMGDAVPTEDHNQQISEYERQHLVKCLESFIPRFMIPVAFYHLEESDLLNGIKVKRGDLQNRARQLWSESSLA